MMNQDHKTSSGSQASEIVTPQKMDAALKAKWVEALRSGKYKQALGNLRAPEGFCCLGVLADVAGLEFEKGEKANSLLVDGKSAGYLPLSDLIGKDDLADLWWRNDGQQGFDLHSFAEIADYIEANL